MITLTLMEVARSLIATGPNGETPAPTRRSDRETSPDSWYSGRPAERHNLLANSTPSSTLSNQHHRCTMLFGVLGTWITSHFPTYTYPKPANNQIRRPAASTNRVL